MPIHLALRLTFSLLYIFLFRNIVIIYTKTSWHHTCVCKSLTLLAEIWKLNKSLHEYVFARTIMKLTLSSQFLIPCFLYACWWLYKFFPFRKTLSVLLLREIKWDNSFMVLTPRDLLLIRWLESIFAYLVLILIEISAVLGFPNVHERLFLNSFNIVVVISLPLVPRVDHWKFSIFNYML